jgi:tRNA G18 (ribose-2'-O)-methylase SpoU
MNLVVIAVDIRSAHNVGSIFRSCEGFGSTLILTGITPRPGGAEDDDRLPHIARKASAALHKTALGAEDMVQWHYEQDVIHAINTLRQAGYVVYAIEQDAKAMPLATAKKSMKIALVFGTEVTGLTQTVLDACDSIYEIPMKGHKESFNVAVTVGIALYQFRTM